MQIQTLLQQTTQEWFFKTLQKADLLFAFLHEFGKDHWHAENWHSSGWWFTDDTIQYRCEDLFDDHSDGYNWTFESNDSFRQMLIYILKSHGFEITHNSGDEEDGLFIMKRPTADLLEEKEVKDVSDEDGASEIHANGEYGNYEDLSEDEQIYWDLTKTHFEFGRQSLRPLINDLQQENEQLRRWKAEQIAVTPDMQAIGKAIGVPLGKSIHDKILPAIEALKAENQTLQQSIKQLESKIEESYRLGRGEKEKKDALLQDMSALFKAITKAHFSALPLSTIEAINERLTKYNNQK